VFCATGTVKLIFAVEKICEHIVDLLREERRRCEENALIKKKISCTKGES
jgi:hypothetical protein